MRLSNIYQPLAAFCLTLATTDLNAQTLTVFQSKVEVWGPEYSIPISDPTHIVLPQSPSGSIAGVDLDSGTLIAEAQAPYYTLEPQYNSRAYATLSAKLQYTGTAPLVIGAGDLSLKVSSLYMQIDSQEYDTSGSGGFYELYSNGYQANAFVFVNRLDHDVTTAIQPNLCILGCEMEGGMGPSGGVLTFKLPEFTLRPNQTFDILAKVWANPYSNAGHTSSANLGELSFIVPEGTTVVGVPGASNLTWIKVVPLPMSVWLFASGLLSLLVMARRKSLQA